MGSISIPLPGQISSGFMNHDGTDDSNFNPRDSPRLMGYIMLFISSLINFTNAASVELSYLSQGRAERGIAVSFGVLSFVISLSAIVIHHLNVGKMLLTERGSLPEGILLAFLSLLWLSSVGYTTRVEGIAFRSLNVYFSEWFCLFLSVKTFYNWSISSGFLESYIGVSETIPGWISLLFSSLVEVFTAVDAHMELDWEYVPHAAWSITSGLVSITSCIIMMGKNYLPNKSYIPRLGQQSELYLAVFLIVWWAIGVWTLTQSGTIGSTIVGSQGDCNNNGDFLPGSNMYFALWGCFFTSCWIVVDWRENNDNEQETGTTVDKPNADLKWSFFNFSSNRQQLN